jgi:hypothetical protein
MASFSVSRRTFIAGFTALAVTPAAATGQTTETGIYAAESGKHGTWPRVFGVMTVLRPAVHGAAIELIRRKTGYPRELRYMSTDRGKTAFARAVTDYFATQPDFRFRASVIHEDLAAEIDFGNVRVTADAASNLAQLARFLTGCVHGATTGIRHPVKAELIAHLEEQIGRLAMPEQARRFAISSYRKNNTG